MPAGVCWFVVPMRFCDWAGEVDGVYLLTRRLSRASAATALLLLPVGVFGVFGVSGVTGVQAKLTLTLMQEATKVQSKTVKKNTRSK